jgi:hypothetical protein
MRPFENSAVNPGRNGIVSANLIKSIELDVLGKLILTG